MTYGPSHVPSRNTKLTWIAAPNTYMFSSTLEGFCSGPLVSFTDESVIIISVQEAAKPKRERDAVKREYTLGIRNFSSSRILRRYLCTYVLRTHSYKSEAAYHVEVLHTYVWHAVLCVTLLLLPQSKFTCVPLQSLGVFTFLNSSFVPLCHQHLPLCHRHHQSR